MNTIKVKKYTNVIEEYEAASAITPGMLVELTSDGKVQPHSTAGGNALIMVALEDELQGKDITQAYAAGDRVQVWIPNRGDIALMLLEDGQNVAIGAFVESNGAGYIQAHTVETWNSADAQQANTVYSMPIIGQMLEAQDLSALDGSNSSLATNSQYVKVRIK